MQKTIRIQLLPREATTDHIISEYAAQASGHSPKEITGFHILKRSIDARSKQPKIILTLQVFINEPFQQRAIQKIIFGDVSNAARKVIIVGAGPAGLFAALKLVESGIQPIILERGKTIRARRRDLALLNKEGIINPESNYCFGEGGAGTYSDGKLYTRSTKRGNVDRILNILVQFGAEENILYEAHPHIGTNKLPRIITAMHDQLIQSGAKVLFEKKVTDLIVQDQIIKGVKTADGNSFEADAVILATGHSARDIFHLLHEKKILIEFKPFALGVRIEHPQSLIDNIQYHCGPLGGLLPPAAYSLVEQIDHRGVFSFCMCPGGIIAPAATSSGELVVNGWSPSKRNNPFANSGIVVNIEEKDTKKFHSAGALAGLYFQQEVERKAFEYGGGKFVAPAQRMTDFVDGKISSSLPDCSYLPGIHSTSLREVLPGFVFESLRKAFVVFGKKMKGYYTNDAIIVATESRTSSPVRIPRNDRLQHPVIHNLYPCGEGAGYAGGIVSAAMDGERVAGVIAELLIC
ncbi:MAG: FAD-dependent oxidoreductase [Bacteroidetes bacterium]|nr:FAD-dependent oxidoreductase [Bacteroidota bacterium]